MPIKNKRKNGDLHSSPDQDKQKKLLNINRAILLTSLHRSLFRAEKKRTGATPRMFLADDMDRPEGLTFRTVNKWINGSIKEALPAHLDYVLKRWAKLPDDTGRVLSDGTVLLKGGRRGLISESWVSLTEKMSAKLNAEFTRTGASPHTFLDDLQDAPAQLTSRIIKTWVYSQAKTVNTELWDFVMMQLKALPDHKAGGIIRKPRKKFKNRPDHREITDIERETLKAHRQRTSVGAIRMMRGATDKPKGLQGYMINGWMSGTTRTALPQHIIYVLARYADYPTRI